MEKVEMFFSTLSWFTYATVPPVCAFFGWLAFPFAFFTSILAIVFGTVQLWKAISNLTNPLSNEMSEYSNFASTNEALKTIFSQASDEEIAKYEKQLDTVKIFDPVLIITPNQTWINQHGLPAYNAVMDAFATNGLQNRRRDRNSRSIFHFTENEELYTVRRNVRNLIPNAFFVPTSLQSQLSNAQLHPVGTAWILLKVAALKSDFGEDENFFHVI
ncbi:17659_t:CDS:2 [Acaulospora morrowiae]|uniref:17659_t:CDS:1 n=1 Tax=Acaulospora morrowiae TaxID=94023 RepID=A0A9N8ZV44_9GLOM|nr:17659_t:CDS:2 [Acaulospora morrowiae]